MKEQKQKMLKKTTNKEVYTMKSKTNFIVTTDKETANKLTSEGFKLVSEVNGKFTFENKVTVAVFDQVDTKKIAYTNILSL